MKIDAHQHFWRLERGDYDWLTPDVAPLYRDFGPSDLLPMLREAGIDGTILVQAAPTVAETEYLLELARENDFIFGVVGWVDFATPFAAKDIAKLAQDPALVGLRPMIQDLPDDGWMLFPRLRPAFEALIDAGLTFDALVMPRHLPYLLRLANQYPRMRIVIDHAAKPEIASGRFIDWAADMSRLAEETSAFCKLSGLVTEAGADWNADRLRPYVEHLIDAFGPERLVWGSDWPVCRLAADYAGWLETAETLVGDDPADRAAIFGENALSAYGLRT